MVLVMITENSSAIKHHETLMFKEANLDKA
jgi:hypothetical protein